MITSKSKKPSEPTLVASYVSFVIASVPNASSREIPSLDINYDFPDVFDDDDGNFGCTC